jgi:hypothetical protein
LNPKQRGGGGDPGGGRVLAGTLQKSEQRQEKLDAVMHFSLARDVELE